MWALKIAALIFGLVGAASLVAAVLALTPAHRAGPLSASDLETAVLVSAAALFPAFCCLVLIGFAVVHRDLVRVRAALGRLQPVPALAAPLDSRGGAADARPARPTSEPDILPPGTDVATAAEAILYERPSHRSRPVAILRRDLPAAVLRPAGEWSEIRTADGREGFVLTDLLDPRPLAGTTAPTA